MVLVIRFSPGRPKFTNRKIKGVKIYICNVIKNTKQNEIVFSSETLIISSKKKTDNSTKIISKLQIASLNVFLKLPRFAGID